MGWVCLRGGGEHLLPGRVGAGYARLFGSGGVSGGGDGRGLVEAIWHY